MKSFQKFIVLTVLSYAICVLLFIFSNKGNIKFYGDFFSIFRFPWLVFFSIFLGYFAIATFSYVYVFEGLQQKKERIVRNLLIAVGSLSILVIVYNGFILGNFFVSTKNLYSLITGNYLLCICIFSLEYLAMTLLTYSSKSYQLVFDEKKLFYFKLILSISIILSIFGMMFILGQIKNAFPTFNYFSVHKLRSIFLEIGAHCLLVTSISFILIWGLSRVLWFKKNNLILVVILFIAQMFLLKLQIQVYDNHYLNSIFDPSTLSAPLLMVVLLYRNKQKTTDFKIKSLTNAVSKKEAEYLQLKQQVNPHFLFNNLNTLISFIEIDPKKAIEFGHHLSNTYRHYLKNQNDDFVLLKEELEFIKAYLEIYKAKFENGFTFEIIAVPKENDYILSFSLQEIVDNIFKHNSIDENSPMEITISSSDNGLSIENSVSNKFSEQSTQVGLENINKRYKILTNKEIQILNNTKIYQITLPILKLEA